MYFFFLFERFTFIRLMDSNSLVAKRVQRAATTAFALLYTLPSCRSRTMIFPTYQ